MREGLTRNLTKGIVPCLDWKEYPSYAWTFSHGRKASMLSSDLDQNTEPCQGLGSCYTTNNHIDNDNSEFYNDNSDFE